MQIHKYWVSVFFVAINILVMQEVAHSSNGKHWEIVESDKVIITIDDNVVVRKELPDTMFSFNINYFSFQQQLWDKKEQSVSPNIIEKLKQFPGSIFRYPGGIVANNVDWLGIVGAMKERKPQKSLYHKKPELISFGIDEYINLVDVVSGKAWYVLNLLGINALEPQSESDSAIVAKHNRELAKYLKPKLKGVPHFYQLGNELDRSKYEWSSEKYLERSRETIQNILEVDSDARFVAFLRDFPWKYKKNPVRGVSEPYDLMKTVLEGLPMVNDYSLHHYYDGKRNDGKSWSIPFWLRHMNKSIEDYKKIRKGESPNIWITEHARQKSSNSPNKDPTRFYVSNLGGSISTADYLIALAQIPEVKGAFIHGLNAGAWQMFDYSVKYKDLRPRPVFETMALLRNTKPRTVLKTRTQSTNYSNYNGGYDVRAVGFRNAEKDQLAIWVVNRASKAQDATIEYAPFSGNEVIISHRYVAGEDGVDADDINLIPVMNLKDDNIKSRFNEKGQLIVNLPPSSISNILLTTDTSKVK